MTKQKEFIAIYYVLFDCGVGIYEIIHDVDDCVVCACFNGDTVHKRTKNRIYYTVYGHAYIIKNGNRYYLNDFIKKEVA